MKKIFENRGIYFLIFALYFVMAHSAFSQNTDAIRLDEKITIDMTDADFITILSSLAVNERLAIGLERSSNHKTTKLNIQATDRTIREILEMIAEQRPDYKWQIRDGVINFYPADDSSEIAQTFLGTCVSRLSTSAGASRFMIRDALFDTPEIKEFLTVNELEGLKEYYPYKKSIYSSDSQSIEMQNKNVINILNSIVLRTEFKIWVVEVSRDGKKLLVSF